MYQRHKRIDKLKSVLSNSTGKTKYNIKCKISALRTKIQNIITNLHRKCAKFLTENFKYIVIPDFCTKEIVQKKRLRPHVKHALLSLSHYKFRQRLLHKAHLNGSVVIVCKEYYTSKTCGNCGGLNLVDENIKCKCGYIADRDINAARNILLRHLSIGDGSDTAH